MKTIAARLVNLTLVTGLSVAASLAASASAQSAPRGADPAESLLRRAAYQETQKQESAKAVEIYREVVKRYPDSPAAAKALERIAALQTQLGDVAAAREAQAQLTALRAKGVPPEEIRATTRRELAEKARRRNLRSEIERIIADGRKKGQTPAEIRARVRKLLEEQKAKGDDGGSEKGKVPPKKGRLD